MQGDAYVHAEDTLKVSKKELKSTLSRVQKSPRVYASAITSTASTPPKGLEKLFLSFEPGDSVDILWVDQPPQGV